MVEHLISLGHREICNIAGPQDPSTGAARMRGFVGAMRANGANVDDSQIAVGNAYVREAGERAAMQLLAHERKPTTIVAANDLLALGSYDALRSLGLTCPNDVSITRLQRHAAR